MTETPTLNTSLITIFIVDANSTSVRNLRRYLDERFGDHLSVYSFYNGQSALKKVSSETNIVLLDHDLVGENGNELLKSIKKINPKTKVIMLSSNDDVGRVIESFRKGADDYVLKGSQTWSKISSHVYGLMAYPVRYLVQELKLK